MGKRLNKQLTVFMVLFFANFALAQLPFIDNKRNLCFINSDKIIGSSYQNFRTQNVVFGNFTHQGNFADALFLDNNLNKLFLSVSTGSVSLPQFSSTLIPLYAHPNCMSGNVVAGDLNGDAFKDFALINSSGDILTFQNTNGIVFPKDSIGNTLTSSGFGGKLFVTNNDNTNFHDLISIGAKSSPNGFYYQVQNNNSNIGGPLVFNAGNSGFVKATSNVPSSSFDAASVDLDNNGYDEIVFISGQDDSVTILVNILGNLSTKVSYGSVLPNVQHKRIKAMDVNGDGYKEVAILGKLSGISYVHIYSPTYSNNIPTGLNYQKTITMFFDVSDFVFSDLNKDGLSDLIVNSTSSNSLAVYMQDKVSPLSFENVPITFGTPAGHAAQGLASFDVDDNKREEIFSYATGTVSSIIALRNFTYLDSLKVISTPSVICPGDTVVLQNKLDGYFFSYFSTFSPITGLNDPFHKLNVTSPTTAVVSSTYTTFFINFPPCVVNSNSVQIKAGIVPTITLSGPSNLCKNSTATITASGADSYTWSTGGTVNLPYITLTPTVSVPYNVTGKITDGCVASKSATLGLFPDFVPTIVADKPSMCKNKSSVLTASGGVSYFWTTGQFSQSISVTQTLTTPQTYSVYVTDVNGCSGFAFYSTVYSDACKDVSVKNGITLNNDGKNDFLFVENIESYPNNKVMIFNRWGVELYSQVGYDNADKIWPSQTETASLTPGTYYYIVDLGNGDVPQKGWLEIIKN